MNKLAKAIHNPWLVYSYAAGKGLTDWVPDGPHLKAMYRATIGKRLNLDNPVTFNEKLQWLKIHDRNPPVHHARGQVSREAVGGRPHRCGARDPDLRDVGARG